MLISVSVQSFDDNSSEHLFSLGMTAAIKENIPKLLIKSVSFVIYNRVWKPRQALGGTWGITVLTSNITLKFLSLTLRCCAVVRICAGSTQGSTSSPPQICETAHPEPAHSCLSQGSVPRPSTHSCSQWERALGIQKEQGLEELGQKSHEKQSKESQATWNSWRSELKSSLSSPLPPQLIFFSQTKAPQLFAAGFRM